ncbi:MAG: ankyrin repeat domain-containing protein [Spirochaetales bacterium]|nr:ankyrin repeat domain-containing protein [Spirochaetales bacterium]
MKKIEGHDLDIRGLQISEEWKKTDIAGRIEMIQHAPIVIVVWDRQLIDNSWFWYIFGWFSGRSANEFRKLFLYSELDNADSGIPVFVSEKAALYKRKEPLSTALLEAQAELKKHKKKNEAAQALQSMGFAFSSEAMVLASSEGNIDAVTRYLEVGFDPDSCDHRGVPALIRAIRTKNDEVALLLLEAGANPNLQARDNGNTPLIAAAAFERTKILTHLLNLDIELDAVSKNKQSALIVAVGTGVAENVRLLVDAGADTTIRDALGMTAGDYARLFKNDEILKILTK